MGSLRGLLRERFLRALHGDIYGVSQGDALYFSLGVRVWLVAISIGTADLDLQWDVYDFTLEDLEGSALEPVTWALLKHALY